MSAVVRLAPVNVKALTVFIAETSTKPLAPVPNVKATFPDVVVMVLAEKYSPAFPPVPLIFSPLNVNPPAVPIVDTDKVPEPPPLMVIAPSADKVVAIVTSELPVPFVIVAAAEATVIAVEDKSTVEPKVIVVVPDADKIPKFCADVCSVELDASNVKAPASIVTALTCPDPDPNVMETLPPETSCKTAASPLPKALVIESAPPVFKEDAVIEPLPATFIVRLAEAVMLLSVKSLY